MNEVIEKTKTIIADFLTQMGLDADINVSVAEMEEAKDGVTYLNVELEGENLNELIGHHGKNLESAQIVFGMILNKQLGDRNYRILLDINSYKKSREKYLTSFALRAADQVRESGQEMELEPMKPSERRVVHMALQNEKDIETESLGEGEERRVVIKRKE